MEKVNLGMLESLLEVVERGAAHDRADAVRIGEEDSGSWLCGYMQGWASAQEWMAEALRRDLEIVKSSHHSE